MYAHIMEYSTAIKKNDLASQRLIGKDIELFKKLKIILYISNCRIYTCRCNKNF